ncbi:MAG: asparaginase [Suilimivivens sp.]
MKKILVVLTGGTIGSRVEDYVINVKEGSPYRLLSLYEEFYGKEEFEVIHPLNILSENMTPDSLLILLKSLDEIDYGKYAGVIVTHGSDTLSYTTAFAGFLFHHLSVPMIFVASNYPLGQKGSNGLNNFAKAVELIRGRAVRGVFALYQDQAGISQVYLATRIHEAEPIRDQFRDFSGNAFGRMEDGHLILNTARGEEMQPTIEEVEANVGREFEVPASFAKKVMLIRPYPGMDYSFFQFSEKNKPAAVLHYLYHSATSCLEGEAYSLLPFVEQCHKMNIDVYAASYKRTEGNQYATGDALLKAGVIPLLNISPEAAYAKLMLLYNSRGQMRRELARENIYFESIEFRNV